MNLATSGILVILLLALVHATPWVPEPREEWWLKRHQHLLDVTHKNASDIKVVFLGDSITEGWAGNGKQVWQAHYHSRHAYNYGIGGDRTEHVLWRIQHGEFDKLNPKVIVLMIGTNNIPHKDKVVDIGMGVKTILDQLHSKMPHAKILLLSVFPRGGQEFDTEVHQINTQLATFKNVYVEFLNVTETFETGVDRLKTNLYVQDHLHLSASGYQAWYAAMEKTFARLLGSM